MLIGEAVYIHVTEALLAASKISGWLFKAGIYDLWPQRSALNAVGAAPELLTPNCKF